MKNEYLRKRILKKGEKSVMDIMGLNNDYSCLTIENNIYTYYSKDLKKECVIIFSEKGRAKEVVFKEN